MPPVLTFQMCISERGLSGAEIWEQRPHTLRATPATTLPFILHLSSWQELDNLEGAIKNLSGVTVNATQP